MNKKAGLDVARKSIYWMILVVVIAGMYFAFDTLLSLTRIQSVQVPMELKGELISLRFTNSPECFAFQDQTNGRIYPGIIDLEKFKESRLNQNCYILDKKTSAKRYNFRLDLQSLDRSIETIMYAKGTDFFTIKKRVLVKDGDIFTKDILTIYVIEKIGKSKQKAVEEEEEEEYDYQDDIGDAAWGGAAVER